MASRKNPGPLTRYIRKQKSLHHSEHAEAMCNYILAFEENDFKYHDTRQDHVYFSAYAWKYGKRAAQRMLRNEIASQDI